MGKREPKSSPRALGFSGTATFTTQGRSFTGLICDTMVFTRFVDPSEIARLADPADVSLAVWSFDPVALAVNGVPLKKMLPAGDPPRPAPDLDLLVRVLGDAAADPAVAGIVAGLRALRTAAFGPSPNVGPGVIGTRRAVGPARGGTRIPAGPERGGRGELLGVAG